MSREDQGAEAPKPNDGRSAATASGKRLSPAAQRALAEAAARRAARKQSAGNPPKEIAGRGGLDPARYGDWEVKGVASDF